MKAYYTAKQVINEALAGVGDFQREYYAEAAMYFMRGYRDFALFNSFQLKSAWLSINALNRTVKIPEDCLRVESVGVSINGEFFSFTESEDMVKPSDPLDSQLLSDRNESDEINRSPRSGYGTKSTNMEYYYKVDESNRRILLNRIAVDKTRFADRTEVLVKFVSNNIDDLNTAVIDGSAANMLIAFVEWKMAEALREKFNRFDRADKKLNFEEAESRFRLLLIPSIDEMMDVIYESAGQNARI